MKETKKQKESESSLIWRHADHETGGGLKTNEKLKLLTKEIRVKILYGSVCANMLVDRPSKLGKTPMSGCLPKFYSDEVQQYLQKTLCWVVENMPNIKYIACLGTESWHVATKIAGNKKLNFKISRNTFTPNHASIQDKNITIFPMYHPAARVRKQIIEGNWSNLQSSIN